MNCAEFQNALPYMIDKIDSGGSPEHDQHLRDCAVCSDLVRDLRYIAEQAKLLVPMEDPDPRVWDGIQKSLEREGLVKSNKLSRSATHLKIVKVTSLGILALVTVLLLSHYGPMARSASAATPANISSPAR